MGILFPLLTQSLDCHITFLEQAFLHLTQPSRHSMVLSTAADLTRTKSDLIAEIALLHQQLLILHRQFKKPTFSQSDRLWLVLLASRVKYWDDGLLILKPDTLLRWHRQGFRLFWKFKVCNRGGRPRLAAETISLIQKMAKENALWGAPQTQYRSCHDHHQKVFTAVSSKPSSESNLVSFSQEPCPRRLGV